MNSSPINLLLTPSKWSLVTIILNFFFILHGPTKLTSADLTTTPSLKTIEPVIVTATVCPPAAEIFPCSCSAIDDLPTNVTGQLGIYCQGSNVTQEIVDQVIQKLRSVNGVSKSNSEDSNNSPKILHLLWFSVQSTSLNSLDISSFFFLSFYALGIADNRNLTQVVTSTPPPQSQQIRTNMLFVSLNKMTDESVDHFLGFIDHRQLERLQIGNTRNDLPDRCRPHPPIKILPIAYMTQVSSRFDQLRSFDVESLFSQIFEDAPFRRMKFLQSLTFSFTHGIQFGRDAFLFDESVANLRIEFRTWDNLTDDRFHDVTGLQSLKGGNVTLDLSRQSFQFLSQSKFEPFLMANSSNRIILSENPVNCSDSRVKWLGKHAEIRKGQVVGPFEKNCFVNKTQNVNPVVIVNATVCPAAKEIFPCNCSVIGIEYGGENETWPVDIQCIGSEVTQTVLDQVVRKLRSINGISGSDSRSNGRKLVYVQFFVVRDTDLSSLDISPFFSLSFDTLFIQNNANLSHVFSPGGFEKIPGQHQIRTNGLYLMSNSMTDETIGEFLKFVNDDHLKSLLISDRNSDKKAGCDQNGLSKKKQIAFMEQVSRFDQLEMLQFMGLCGGIVEDAPFWRMKHLWWLSFEFMDNLQFGPNAFLFQESVSKLRIAIHPKNNLTDGNFHEQTGLHSLYGGEVWLDLASNNFTFLSQNKFEPILRANWSNRIVLSENPLKCGDPRIKWLEQYDSRHQQKIIGSFEDNCFGKDIPSRW